MLTLVSLVFLLFSFPLVYLSLPVYPPFIFYVAIAVSVAGGSVSLLLGHRPEILPSRRRSVRFLFWLERVCFGASGSRLVGVMTVVLPFFGAAVFIAFLSSWLAASIVRTHFPRSDKGNSIRLRGDSALLSLFALWLMVWLPSVVHVIFSSGDFSQLLAIYHEWGFRILREALFASYFPTFRAVRFIVFSGITSLVFVWIFHFSNRILRDVRQSESSEDLFEPEADCRVGRQMFCSIFRTAQIRDLFSGIVIGFFICVLVALLQRYAVHPVFSYNISPFWLFQKRLSGTFSDPNALTIAGSLILAPLVAIVAARRSVYTAFIALVALLLFVLMLLNGGRTFYLAIFMTALLLLVQQRRRYFLHGRVLWLLLVTFASAALMLVYPPSNLLLQRCLPFLPLQRVLRTVNFDTAAEMFFSRMHFARLALEVWKEQPATGVGFGMFIPLQRVAAGRLGLEISDWLDNANNFYLEVLVGGGLLGLVALGIFALGVIVFWSKHELFRKSSRSVCCALAATPLFVFPLILCTGPHTNFYEVQALWIAIFLFVCDWSGVEVLSVEERVIKRVFLAGLFVCGVAVFAVIGLAAAGSRSAEVGVYPDEGTADERLFWTGKEALVQLHSAGGLSFRALQPNLLELPLTVRLRETVSCSLPGSREEEITVADNQWRVFSIQGAGSTVCLEVDRTWIPKQHNLGADARVLGLQVEIKR